MARHQTQERDYTDLRELEVPHDLPPAYPCSLVSSQVSPHPLHSGHKEPFEAQEHILLSHGSEPLFAPTSQYVQNTIPQPNPTHSQLFCIPTSFMIYFLLKVVPASLPPFPPSSGPPHTLLPQIQSPCSNELNC